MTFHEIKPSRRAFLAGAGLVIGFAVMPRALAAAASAGRRGGRRCAAGHERLRQDRHRRHGHDPLQAHRIRAGAVHRPRHADRRGTRRRLEPDARRAFAGRRQDLRQSRLRPAGHGRLVRHRQFLRAVPRRRAPPRAPCWLRPPPQEWGVPAAEITVVQGPHRHAASGKESGFGALADKAAQQSPPAEPKLKDPKDFVLIGRDLPKLDTLAKSTGTAIFTLDVLADNMLVALVAHPDHFGATVKSFDDTEARAIKGVVDVKQVPQGVAVYADTTFAALKGRDALVRRVGSEPRPRSARLPRWRRISRRQFAREGARGDQPRRRREGVRGRGCPEPGSATSCFPSSRMRRWSRSTPSSSRATTACSTSTPARSFRAWTRRRRPRSSGSTRRRSGCNTQLAGGSFGRRAQFGSPYMQEAAAVFAATDGKRPVKHMWTREDDIRGGFYRPMYLHRMKGSIDADGKIVAWDQSIVGQSIMGKADLDETSVEGASNLPYAIANLRVISHNVEARRSRRSGGAPSATRIRALPSRPSSTNSCRRSARIPSRAGWRCSTNEPRYIGVLKKVAEMADWGSAVPEGRERGVAVVKSFGTYVAQIAEVSRGEGDKPRRAQGLVRGRLRRGDQPERHPRADGGRRRLRPRRRAVRRDHARPGRQDHAVQLPRLPLAAHQRDAACRGGDHRVHARSRPASASRARRPSGPPSPMPGAG